MKHARHRFRLLALIAVLMLPPFIFQPTSDEIRGSNPDASATSSYIVQASTATTARDLVIGIGGHVTATLEIINAVGAELSQDQVERLRSGPEMPRIYADGTLNVSGSAIETSYPTLVGAAELHAQGINGSGITVAVLDTGLWRSKETEFHSGGRTRILAQYDTTTQWRSDDLENQSGGEDADWNDNDDDDDSWIESPADINDWNGHGTHITSIIMSSARSGAGLYHGVAPSANVVAVRAFEPDGSGTYLNVIRALDWIVSQRKKYKIRILNLSFGAAPASHYWDDPVNQAVMAAWEKGIIVVAAAGNGGPGPMTVGVPGNVPYVITVGAMTDNFTPHDASDDRLATFSAAGPTFEGFVKPDLVAPGGHMLGQMPPYAWLPLAYPNYIYPVDDHFTMSGTSQAAAVVSGVLALMLQVDNELGPDEAKCRLMASASTALREDGTHAYSVFQQGAGMINAVAAINETVRDCANRKMKVKEDLKGKAHYVGPAGVDEAGTYYLVDEYAERLSGPGYQWRQGSLWKGRAVWRRGAIWNQGGLWHQGTLWDDRVSTLNSDSLLSQGALWPEGSLWNEGLTRPAAISVWVDRE